MILLCYNTYRCNNPCAVIGSHFGLSQVWAVTWLSCCRCCWGPCCWLNPSTDEALRTIACTFACNPPAVVVLMR